MVWEKLPKHFTCLAPMEGVTDCVFRQVITKAGRPDLFFTEFTNVSSFASEKGRENALERLKVVETDVPIIAQIWGKNPEHFAETAKNLEQLGFSGLDLNMGCPDRHVNKAGGGAAMIRTPELAKECIINARNNTNLPVSVKTRLGFTFIEEYQDWLSFLLKLDLSALTVHLRTRKEMSKVNAHFELIPEIIKLRNSISPHTKLIINGDIKNKSMCEQLATEYPDLDGFMIGRGVFQNPYCFAHFTPNKKSLLNLFLYHLDLFDDYTQQTHYPYEPLKHFFKIYVNTYDGASELRSKLMECTNTAELREIIYQELSSCN